LLLTLAAGIPSPLTSLLLLEVGVAVETRLAVAVRVDIEPPQAHLVVEHLRNLL
jgi:hypothetical protein